MLVQGSRQRWTSPSEGVAWGCSSTSPRGCVSLKATRNAQRDITLPCCLVLSWLRCNSFSGTGPPADNDSGKDSIQRVRENHLLFHYLPNISQISMLILLARFPLLHFKLIKALGAFGCAPWFLLCQQRSESSHQPDGASRIRCSVLTPGL